MGAGFDDDFDGKTDCSMHLLRVIKSNLGNLVGMLVFCVALFDCNILISFKISTFSINEKLKLDLELHFSLMATILGWALYFTITIMTVSLIFSNVRSI